MWATVLGWLSGPIVSQLLSSAVAAYKAKLEAGNNADQIAADLAGRELAVQQREAEVQAQYRTAALGRWYEPDKLIGYAIAVYVSKIYVWDAALHLGSTDPVKGEGGTVLATVIMFYFGKRAFENVARILKH